MRWVVAVCVLVALWAPTIARADASMERQFTDAVHRERAAAGRAAYAERGDLAAVARRHAERMAAQKHLHHNPRLADEVENWDAVGENVGRGPSVEEIHQAFMNSPSHRGEILSTTFTEIGVGVAVSDDGEIWVAEVFRKPSAAPAPAPAPTEPAPQPQPAPAPVRAARTQPAPPPPPPPIDAPAPSTAASSTNSTTDQPAAPPHTTDTPDLLAAVAPPASTTSSADASTRPARQMPASVAPSSRRSAEPEVGTAVRVAATLLVLVVAGLTAHVGRETGGVDLPRVSRSRRRLAATAATLP